MNSIKFLEGVVEACVNQGLTLDETVNLSGYAMQKQATQTQYPGYVVTDIGEAGSKDDEDSYYSPFLNTYIKRNGTVDFNKGNPNNTTFLGRFIQNPFNTKYNNLIEALPTYQQDLALLENQFNANIARNAAARSQAIKNLYYDSKGMMRPYRRYSEQDVKNRTRTIVANNAVPLTYYTRKLALEQQLKNNPANKAQIQSQLNALESERNTAVNNALNNTAQFNRGAVNMTTLKQQADAAQAANAARENAAKNAEEFSKSVAPEVNGKGVVANEINTIGKKIVRPLAKGIYQAVDTSDNAIMSKEHADQAIGTYKKMKTLNDAASSYL